MTVEVNNQKKAVEVSWEPGDHQGDVTLELTGAKGDVHQTAKMPNDGYGVVTYPGDFTGTTQVQVLDADGNVLDEGEIEV